MMKVAVILGTRPEIIKMAPVIFELKRKYESSTQMYFASSGSVPDILTVSPVVYVDLSSDMTGAA